MINMDGDVINFFFSGNKESCAVKNMGQNLKKKFRTSFLMYVYIYVFE